MTLKQTKLKLITKFIVSLKSLSNYVIHEERKEKKIFSTEMLYIWDKLFIFCLNLHFNYNHVSLCLAIQIQSKHYYSKLISIKYCLWIKILINLTLVCGYGVVSHSSSIIFIIIVIMLMITTTESIPSCK